MGYAPPASPVAPAREQPSAGDDDGHDHDHGGARGPEWYVHNQELTWSLIAGALLLVGWLGERFFGLPRGVAIATNAVALVYILYIISFAGLPTMMPVTKDNMNYAGPMMLAIIFIALADWCISGRKRFRLPEVHFDS